MMLSESNTEQIKAEVSVRYFSAIWRTVGKDVSSSVNTP